MNVRRSGSNHKLISSQLTAVGLLTLAFWRSAPCPADELSMAALGPRNAALARYELRIDKSDRELAVYDRGQPVRRFRISTGRGGPGDKRREGDKHTPVGTYRIVDFNPKSRFHLFMQINSPNAKDAFYGLKQGVIDRADFDRIVNALKNRHIPPQDTPLGSAIGIHGLGWVDDLKLRTHEVLDWTEGCIALTNEEVDELRRYVDIGTRVVITE